MYIEILKQDAIDFAGTKANLARILNITRQAVQDWGDFLPQSSAMKLYLLTNKKIGTVKYGVQKT